MNDNATFAHSMVAAAPAATHNVKLHLGASVGLARVAQFIHAQKGMRDNVI